MTKCPYCGEEFKNYNGLSKHIFKYKAHGCDITKEKLLCDVNYEGNRPKCKCGCGEYTEVGYNGGIHFNDYVRGHQSRVHNNWGHNEVVWESDYKDNKEDVIMKIKNKITSL